ncbi:E3 ubiquitin-protein ligase MARCHF8 [Taenia solium]|eukprot:TsM_000410800 transcript=TsM_000410800 gene=TsM_000410800
MRSICASVTPLCRICYGSNEFTIDRDLDCRGRLIALCFCKGSIKYIRQWRIQRWNEVIRSRKCELCHYRQGMRRRARRNKGTGTQKVRRYLMCNNCGVYMRWIGERREDNIHVAAEELASPPETEAQPP